MSGSTCSTMCTSCVAIARPLPAQGTPRAPCRRIRIQATTPAWTLRAQSVANAQRTPMRTTTIPRFARPAKSVTRPCWMLRHPRFPRPLSRARRSPSLQCSSPALPLRSPSNHPSPDLRRPKCVCQGLAPPKRWSRRQRNAFRSLPGDHHASLRFSKPAFGASPNGPLGPACASRAAGARPRTCSRRRTTPPKRRRCSRRRRTHPSTRSRAAGAAATPAGHGCVPWELARGP